MDPIAVRQKYIQNQSSVMDNWNKIFGQQVAIFRFIKSENPNVDKARRVFGYERVQSNISRLDFIQNIEIPVSYDSLVNAYADRNFSVDFMMPNDIIKIGDILTLEYLGQRLEFLVESVESQYETYFKYSIRTRKSEPDK